MQCNQCGEHLSCSMCQDYFYDDELDPLEDDDEDTDDDLDFEDEKQAEQIYLEYDNA